MPLKTIFVVSKEQLIAEATTLLIKEFPFAKPVRLLGVTLSNFNSEMDKPSQMTLKF